MRGRLRLCRILRHYYQNISTIKTSKLTLLPNTVIWIDQYVQDYKRATKTVFFRMVEKMCKFMHLSPSEQADMEESYHIALIGRENYYRRKAVQQFFEEFRIPTLQLPATSPSNASDYADNVYLASFLILRSIARSFTSSPRN